jgi:hypothetical protein
VETEEARPMGAEDGGTAGGEEEHFSTRISTAVLYSGGNTECRPDLGVTLLWIYMNFQSDEF